jgi:protein required for attachment to host cells
MTLRIEHSDLVLVADGRKALVLRNHGDAERVDLRVEQVLKDGPNPKTSEQGSDKPGRTQDSMTGRPSALEQADWHHLAEAEFAKKVAGALNEHDRLGKVKSLVVVAPPAALSELRNAWSHALRLKVKAEIAKDLTKHPLGEIERLLAT